MPTPTINLQNTPLHTLLVKTLASLTSGVCLLAASTALSANQNDVVAHEGYTHAIDTVGADAWIGAQLSTSPTFKESTENDALLALEPRHILWFGGDIWISNIGTLLYTDSDRDGYFSGFSLTIDADTSYSQADVYAAIDIQLPAGERERLHTTGTFSIYGNSLTDEYRIDIELVQNYPIGDYDLFIDLVDANNHEVVDRVDAYSFSNLAGLPLEAEDLDNQPLEYAQPHSGISIVSNNTDIRVAEYSGALDAWALLAIGLPLMSRRRRGQHAQKSQ